MTLEKSSDLEKAIETKPQEKEKKGYLRQLCERLHLDSTRDYSKEEIDQLEPSNSKRKFLIEIIGDYEKLNKQKSSEAFNKRREEIENLKRPPLSRPLAYKSPLTSLSQIIYSLEHRIIENLTYIQILRLTNNETAKTFLISHPKHNLEKDVEKRKKFVEQYKKKLQEYKKLQECT